jgi:hypothetical protein
MPSEPASKDDEERFLSDVRFGATRLASVATAMAGPVNPINDAFFPNPLRTNASFDLLQAIGT